MNNRAAWSSPTTSRMIAADTGIALGLGLANECNLRCAFCYRDPTRADRLSLDQVKAAVECLPVRSVSLGTGENGMHPDVKARRAYLNRRLHKGLDKVRRNEESRLNSLEPVASSPGGSSFQEVP